MGATILVSLAFISILIIGHELGHFLAARYFGVRVNEFGFGFPPRLLAKKIGETKYSLNLLPFGGFIKIHGETEEQLEQAEAKDYERSFISKPVSQRAAIIVAGVLVNFIIGWLAFSLVFSQGIPNKVIIEEVFPESPAAASGFKAGEEIRGYSSVKEFIDFVDAHKNQPIQINDKTIVPRANPPQGQGPLGVKLVEVGLAKQNPAQSLISGFKQAAQITFLIFKAFLGFIKGLITGQTEVLNTVTGPVGIFNLIGKTSNLGFVYLVQLLGVISLNLTVINLIPFPALDGGRLLFLFIEKLARRRLARLELALNGAGIALLILLMVVITVRDIMKIH